MNLNNLLCEQTADLTVLLQDTFTAGTQVEYEQAAAASVCKLTYRQS